MTTYRTAQQIKDAAKGRHNAAILASTLKLEAEQKVRIDALANGNPWGTLSTDEVLELDRLERVEQAQKAEIRGNYTRMAEFLFLHPELPATPQAGGAVVDYCRSLALPITPANLETAFSVLVNDGRLTPDYSKLNRDRHEQSIEQLRSQGYNIQAPPSRAQLESMPLDQLAALANQQPSNNPYGPTQFEIEAEQLSMDEVLRRAGGWQR